MGCGGGGGSGSGPGFRSGSMLEDPAGFREARALLGGGAGEGLQQPKVACFSSSHSGDPLSSLLLLARPGEEDCSSGEAVNIQAGSPLEYSLLW